MNVSMESQPVIRHLSELAARTLAVEILLSDIEWLQDDILESSLYLLRERLTVQEETGQQAPES